MSSISYSEVDKFLNAIAEHQSYPREELEFVAELRKGGPTVNPGSGFTSDSNIVKTVVASPSTTLPNMWYDTLGSHHVDYKVMRVRGTEKTPIRETLFAFQHHVFPGNCRICIHRWVRIEDPNRWSDKLKAAAFAFRIATARAAGVRTLCISSGRSFSGAEKYDEFDKVYSNGTHSILTIDLQNYKSREVA